MSDGWYDNSRNSVPVLHKHSHKHHCTSIETLLNIYIKSLLLVLTMSTPTFYYFSKCFTFVHLLSFSSAVSLWDNRGHYIITADLFCVHLKWTLCIALRLDVVFLWITLHGKDNWIVFASSVLSPARDTLLMSSKMPLHLSVEGTRTSTRWKKPNVFSGARFSFSHWRRLQRAEELLMEGNHDDVLVRMADWLSEWQTVQFH